MSRRRWHRNRRGKGTGSMSRSRRCSPRVRFGRREAGGVGSMEGRSSDEWQWQPAVWGPDSGRVWARPSSWWDGGASGLGRAALGARGRGGTARGGRRRARRWLDLVSARCKREEWRREGRTGSFPASARGRAASGRDGRCVEAHRRPQSPVWRRGGTVPSTGDPLFTHLTIFESILTS